MSIDYGKFEIFDKILNNAYHFGFTSVDEVIKATDKVYNSLQEADKACCEPAYQRGTLIPYPPNAVYTGDVTAKPGMYYTT